MTIDIQQIIAARKEAVGQLMEQRADTFQSLDLLAQETLARYDELIMQVGRIDDDLRALNAAGDLESPADLAALLERAQGRENERCR
jgi:hypothetical protein